MKHTAFTIKHMGQKLGVVGKYLKTSYLPMLVFCDERVNGKWFYGFYGYGLKPYGKPWRDGPCHVLANKSLAKPCA